MIIWAVSPWYYANLYSILTQASAACQSTSKISTWKGVQCAMTEFLDTDNVFAGLLNCSHFKKYKSHRCLIKCQGYDMLSLNYAANILILKEIFASVEYNLVLRDRCIVFQVTILHNPILCVT